MTSSRRRFLQTVMGSSAAGVLASLAGCATTAASAGAAKYSAMALADGLWQVAGGAANVVLAAGSEGAILVDGGLAADAAQLHRLALGLGGKRVATLFNTHWHPEQTGSNARLGAAGAQIIAHEHTKLWLTRKIVVDWRPGSYGPLPGSALPNHTTFGTGSLHAGHHTIDYGFMPLAHTDGDIYVHFREANVLVCGGMVSADRWPILDWQTGGWIAGWVAAFDKLLKLANDATRIVPANGPLLTRADLKTQRDMYFTLYQHVVKGLNSGLSPAESAAQHPAKTFQPNWGSPDLFIEQAFKSLWAHSAANS